MAIEQLVNEFNTTVPGAITSGATSIVLASISGAPTKGNFRLRLSGSLTGGGTGVEYVQVTSVDTATKTVTVQRATEAPYNTALGFAAGATASFVLTAEALFNMRSIDVRSFGAKGDGKEVYDGAMSSTTVLTSASAAFTAADVGKVIEIKAAGALQSAPSAPTLSNTTTGGTLAAGTYRYRVSAVNDSGETLASTAATTTTTGTTSKVDVTWTAVNQAVRYRIYRSPVAGGAGTELLIMQQGDTYWVDRGDWTQVGGAAVPGAGTMRLYHSTTISTVNSGTSVTLASAASTTVGSGATFTYGTDDGTAIANAVAAVPSEGGTIFFPIGDYLTSRGFTPSPMTQFLGEHSARFSLAKNTTSRCKLRMLSTWNSTTYPGMINANTVNVAGSSYAGIQLRNICLVGNGLGAGVHGIRMNDWTQLSTGGEQSWVIDNITICGMTGCGIYGALWVFLASECFIQMNSAWGIDTGSATGNLMNDVRFSNVWITFNETGGMRVGRIATGGGSQGGANIFQNTRWERSGNQPSVPATPFCKDAPGLSWHAGYKTQFVGCQTDNNTGNGIQIMPTPASIQSNSVSGLTFTDLQCNRDGTGDSTTLPTLRAGLYIAGYRSASPSSSTEGANRISVHNLVVTTGTSNDDGVTGAVGPAYGVFYELAEYLQIYAGNVAGFTNAYNQGNDNYAPVIYDPLWGLQPSMAVNGVGGGFTVSSAPGGSVSMIGGQFTLAAQTQWWGAPQYIGFEYLGSAVLGSAATTVSLSSFQAREELVIMCRVVGLSSTDTVRLRFNSDTGNNYSYRHLTAAAGGTTLTNTQLGSTSGILIWPATGTLQINAQVGPFSNRSAQSKNGPIVASQATAAAATLPVAQFGGSGEWVNTAAQITTIQMGSSGGSATLSAGSGLWVFGRTMG